MPFKIYKWKPTLMPIRLKVDGTYMDFDWKRCVLLIDSVNRDNRDDEDDIFIVKVLEPAVATTTLNFTLWESETDSLELWAKYNWRLKIEGDAIPTWTDLQSLIIVS